jgi:hypothetical protein
VLVLNDLGDCLVASKVHRRFGVSLLHRHFPVENGETLVEEVNLGDALLTLRPKRITIPYAPTNMCFEDEDEPTKTIRLVGLEFASRRELCGVSPINDCDSNILANLRQILARHGKSQRFGIRLLHDPLKLNGCVLLESCDPTNRVLTCRITTTHDPDFRQSIPTTFSWKEAASRNETDLVVAMTCESSCWVATSCESDPHDGHRGKVTHTAKHFHDTGPA